MSSNPSRTSAALNTYSGTPPTFLVSEAADSNAPVLPPVAPVVARSETVHGELRSDDYFWLRDRHDPRVLAYLEAENRYAATVMRHTETLQEQLYQEMRGRIKESDLSVPEPLDEYLYFTRTEAGGQYPILCRRHNCSEVEEVLLDQNTLAAGRYFRLGATEVSPDHKLLAYTVDTCGSEEFTIYIKNLGTGDLLPEVIHRASAGMAWANDGRTLFYTVLDEAHRPCRLYRHAVGTDPTEDVLVYFEPDPSFFLEISRTRSRAYLLLDSSSHSTSEVRFLSADDPDQALSVVQPRKTGVEYTVSHHRGRFFITTNDGAPNFR